MNKYGKLIWKRVAKRYAKRINQLYDNVKCRSLTVEQLKPNTVLIIPKLKNFNSDEKIVLLRSNDRTIYLDDRLYLIKDVHVYDTDVIRMYLDEGIIPISMIVKATFNEAIFADIDVSKYAKLSTSKLIKLLRSFDKVATQYTDVEKIIKIKKVLSSRPNI